MATLDRLSAHGIELEVLHHGAGHVVLLLHGITPLDPAAPVVDLLAAHLARSGEVGAGVRRDVGRGPGDACAEP